MPHVSMFMYCENATNDMTPQGPKLNITGPLHILTPMFVPGMFSFSIVFGILDLETDIDHAIRVIFRSSVAGEEHLIDTGKDILIPRNSEKNDLPKDMRGLMMSLDFKNVVFRSEGLFLTEVLFDGESLGQFPIKVRGSERS
jgi:hypothetical protein